MTEDHDQLCAQNRSTVFKAPKTIGCHEVSGHPDHEQIARALIERQFRRDPRIRATQDRRERLLSQRAAGTPG